MNAVRSFLARLRRHPSGLAAGVFIALLVVLAVVVGLFPQLDPHAMSDDSMAAPSAAH